MNAWSIEGECVVIDGRNDVLSSVPRLEWRGQGPKHVLYRSSTSMSGITLLFKLQAPSTSKRSQHSTSPHAVPLGGFSPLAR